ncbi:MAG TPA: SdrD B-like domain-containing protein [Candidatus Acidoferrum sp.]|nr:SdrD B-like domain-containing protein [Candidatus Acidoferrum sp.]
MKLTQIKTCIAGAALTTCLAAYATPTLIVTDGVVSSGPITDASGKVTYVNTSFNDSWSVVITSGFSKPVFGNAVSPNLEVVIQATSLGATPVNDLYIYFSDTDFGPTTGQFWSLMTGQAASGAGGAVSFTTYYDTNDVAEAMTSELTDSGDVYPGAAGYSNLVSSTPITLGFPYALTTVTRISGANAATYSININFQSLSLLCAGGSGTVGVPFTSALTVTGGVSPYTYSIIGGGLPAGLSLNPTNGVISGTPTAVGPTNFVAQVTDASGRTATTVANNCGITISPAVSLACAGGTGEVGVPYSSSLAVTGGCTPYTFTILSGALPGGLMLNTNTGVISGTPTNAGTFSFVAQVTDCSGNKADTSAENCSIVISPPSCTGSICGSVLRDCDANGNLAGEAGLPGVLVALKSASGATLAVAYTDNNGNYCFTSVSSGTYAIVAATPSGYRITVPASCTNNAIVVPVGNCQNVTAVNFGFTGTYPAVHIVKTGPTNAACGQTITYTIAVTNTGNTCFYGGLSVDDALLGGRIFYQTPVAPGQGFVIVTNYTVKSTDGSTLINTAIATGHPPTGPAVTDQSSVTTIITNSCCTASICGNIFLDCNADGSLTSGDTALGGITVTLKATNGSVIATEVSDTNGNYCFTGLNAGNYYVSVNTPSNYKLTTGTTCMSWTDGNGNKCWVDSDLCWHWKDSNNCHNWIDSTLKHRYETCDGKRYCDDWVNSGRLEKCGGKGVDCNDSAGALCWKGSDGLNHWQDANGCDCWIASDGCIHRKDAKGNECWVTTDHTCHWINLTNCVCWKDKNDNCFSLNGQGQACTNVVDQKEERCSRSTGTNGVQAVCLATCETKNNVNFGFAGTNAAISLTKTANKSSATCGDTITYTFVVKNTGTACFTGGITICDPLLGGTIYTLPYAAPGQSFTFTSNYVVTATCSNPLVNTATATGHVPSGCGLSDVTATASASTKLTLCASCSPPNQSCRRGYSGTFSCSPCFGTAPYKYKWNTGCTSSSLTCSSAGTYTCTVTDATGATCKVTGTLSCY